MTCQELSERMPAVARGASPWSAAEAEHLAACAECRAEFAVVRSGAHLSDDVTVDAEALARRVVLRLRNTPVVRRSARPLWLVGLAAAAAILLVFLPDRATRVETPAPVAQLDAVQVPGLDGLDDEDLGMVLESLGPRWTDTPTIEAPGLDDLDAGELEILARPWEI